MQSNIPQRQILVAECPPQLDFRPITLADIPAINAILQREKSRSCDFSIGGILMWVDFFEYRFCIVDDTLFIEGLCEDGSRRTSFAVPVGRMSLERGVEALKAYCRKKGIELLFTAVPDDKVERLAALGGTVTPLKDWADYIYSASDLATLTGKRFNKKRNHVNRFIADNPGWHLDPLTAADSEELLVFLDNLEEDSDEPMAIYERQQCAEVIRNYALYPFVGGILRLADRSIAAFTAGEIIGDTLIMHIEKMRHDISGAGEAINKLFAERMVAEHPEICFINREDDAGDEGLRYAKESYHPVTLLEKFNVDYSASSTISSTC